ncbi:MAG TPA: hypothetical protein VFS62_17935 [Chloroflexota bacterium]|nr:hypothetical protein [Chloroflexota bacterium]
MTEVAPPDQIIVAFESSGGCERRTHIRNFGQHFARALIFRLVNDMHLAARPRLLRRYEPVIEPARRLAVG